MLIAQRPEVSAEGAEKDNHQSFSIGPLEPGFGYTLGNSLRRILLATLGGAAITKVKFAGVPHEFSTIDGIREDTIDIVLNLKDVVIRSHAEEAAVVSVNVTGSDKDRTVVTAEALNTNADFEILNPSQPIATVSNGAVFEADFTISPGRGYVPAGTIPQSNIGEISIDAIFSPVRRVAVSVVPMQVEESTEYDRLILDIYTDGVISPKNALASAASTLKGLSETIQDFGDDVRGLEFKEIEEEVPQELARSILELSLSQRAENCLLREEIDTVGKLLTHSSDQLMTITNFGKNSLDEVVEKLDEIGLALFDIAVTKNGSIQKEDSEDSTDNADNTVEEAPPTEDGEEE